MVKVTQPRAASERPPRVGREIVIGVGLAIVLLIAFATAWFWWETEGAWQPYRILGVEDEGDQQTFFLSLSCTQGEIRTTVSESDDRVMVLVELRGERSENDCGRGARITLDEPLGARTLIDGSTGELLPIDCLVSAPPGSDRSC